MFSKKELYCFSCAILLMATAYTLMIIDPVEYGFGVLTLWMAPPLLLLGLLFPVMGIIGFKENCKKRFYDALKNNPAKHIGGIGVFIISMCTYVITLEPTASLWDCSEFIATAYKL